MGLVECLGVEGILEMVPPSPVGWGAPVELIGSGFFTLLPLSTVAGLVTLAIGYNRQH